MGGDRVKDTGGVRIVPLTMAASAPLADLLRTDRVFLEQWEPGEDDAYYTEAGQRAEVAAMLDECRSGRMIAWVIVGDGGPVGRINVTNIVMGALRSCAVGYWVARRHAGRGVATEALAQVLEVVFDELGLHRVDAYARVDNAASHRVLRNNGFRQVGVSRGHLHVGGAWRDEIYFQRLAPWDDGVRLEPCYDIDFDYAGGAK